MRTLKIYRWRSKDCNACRIWINQLSTKWPISIPRLYNSLAVRPSNITHVYGTRRLRILIWKLHGGDPQINETDGGIYVAEIAFSIHHPANLFKLTTKYDVHIHRDRFSTAQHHLFICSMSWHIIISDRRILSTPLQRTKGMDNATLH